jgi:hypothetical protein
MIAFAPVGIPRELAVPALAMELNFSRPLCTVVFPVNVLVPRR